MGWQCGCLLLAHDTQEHREVIPTSPQCRCSCVSFRFRIVFYTHGLLVGRTDMCRTSRSFFSQVRIMGRAMDSVGAGRRSRLTVGHIHGLAQNHNDESKLVYHHCMVAGLDFHPLNPCAEKLPCDFGRPNRFSVCTMSTLTGSTTPVTRSQFQLPHTLQGAWNRPRAQQR